MLRKVESLIFTSDKYDEAIAFFEEKLKFEKLAQGVDMARFELGGFPIFVARSEKGAGLFISIETDDMEADHKALKERGIEILEPESSLTNGDKVAFFKGVADIEFMLYQPAFKDEELT